MKIIVALALGAQLAKATIGIGFIGDSITDGYLSSPATKPGTIAVADLNSFTGSTTYSAVNQGVSGSTSADWVSGSTNLNNAISAFNSAGNVSYVLIMLGTNDSKVTVATTASAWKANIQSAISALETAGYNKIVLNYQTYINLTQAPDWNITSCNAMLNQYQAQYASIAAADPTHVFVGDTTAWATFQANPTNLLQDGVHPTGTNSSPSNLGYNTLGGLWAIAFEGLFLGLGGSVISGSMSGAVIH